jgi:hypothetical protein
MRHVLNNDGGTKVYRGRTPETDFQTHSLPVNGRHNPAMQHPSLPARCSFSYKFESGTRNQGQAAGRSRLGQSARSGPNRH